MAKYDVLQMLYNKTHPVEEFNFDALQGPSVYNFFYPEDIAQLNKIATSVKLSGNIKKKLNMIDSVMKSRGFRKFAGGTNRVVYTHYEYPTIVAKVAIDRVGISDNPAEFRNQEFLKPFVAKCFSVSPDGVIAICEKVMPITNLSEFESVSDYIFQIIVFKILGKYVIDDIGVEFFLNWGIRVGSYPCLLDYPYLYKVNPTKLHCTRCDITTNNRVCNGNIDYDGGFNYLVCTECGTKYRAADLGLSIVDELDKFIISKGEKIMKVSVFMEDGRVYSPIEESDTIRKPEVVATSKNNKHKRLEDLVYISTENVVDKPITEVEKKLNILTNLAYNNKVVDDEPESTDTTDIDDTDQESSDNDKDLKEENETESIDSDNTNVIDTDGNDQESSNKDEDSETEYSQDLDNNEYIDEDDMITDNRGRINDTVKNKKSYDDQQYDNEVNFTKKSGKKKHKQFDRKDSIKNMDMF